VTIPLNNNGLETLIHAFVMSRVDYCNTVLAGSPLYITDTLQHVLNAAARFVSGTHKFDQGLSRLLHDELHWLSVPERVQYKLAVTVHRCLQNKAPRYLVDCCIPVSDVASRQHLRSASRHLLTVPHFRRNTFGHRAFSVGGPMAWNWLPDSLQDPSHCSSSFRCNLKTVLFARY